MKQMTATAFRKDLYKSLDAVVATGEPIAIERKGRKLLVVEADKADLFSRLVPRDSIVGDPDELVDLKVWEWNEEKNL
jgi:hypothetical protein